MKINDNLRELRLGRNLTQDQVAEKLNVTRQTVSSYESGRTRPDIDTLIRYSEIFGIELESLIYGYDKELKANRRIKLVAKILFVLLIVISASASLIYLSAHLYFSLPEGGITQELMPVWHAYWNLIEVWKILDFCVSVVAYAGFVLLFILLISGKSKIPVKTKLIFAGVLSAVLLSIPTICGIIDPKYSPQEYILTEIFVTIRLWVFLGIEETVQLFKRKKR